ncbi:PH domain-containing protein [Pseudoxanthomonas sp. 22568]|uniref:PH domain-containing protein n=1 Tax=Pseudoxanthomonas TaxID=83618 RepID=UPI00177D40A9|nr:MULTISPECIES: PH domain-containing protein [Pseudoxanthomonas]MBD9379414.1 PH domain-containing protein [Pseudoxanthomonas sp. PXM04]
MSDLPVETPDAAPPAAPDTASGWQPVPPRGGVLAALGGAIIGIPLAVGAAFVSQASGWLSPWLAAPAVFLIGAVLCGWLSLRRHLRTRWKLDESGFAVRRGNWWQSETHVPISRVQHLDLKRGPLERGMGLATLVVHTAGTRQATVSVQAMDAADAERLRDRLARQLDLDDAL